jgi:hypothetical protein
LRANGYEPHAGPPGDLSCGLLEVGLVWVLLFWPKILRGDLCRVNFEVNNPKPFSHLAFPAFDVRKTAPELLSFDGELMATFPDERGEWSALADDFRTWMQEAA